MVECSQEGSGLGETSKCMAQRRDNSKPTGIQLDFPLVVTFVSKMGLVRLKQIQFYNVNYVSM